MIFSSASLSGVVIFFLAGLSPGREVKGLPPRVQGLVVPESPALVYLRFPPIKQDQLRGDIQPPLPAAELFAPPFPLAPNTPEKRHSNTRSERRPTRCDAQDFRGCCINAEPCHRVPLFSAPIPVYTTLRGIGQLCQ